MKKQMHVELLTLLHEGDKRSLARCISIVENDNEGALSILENLEPKKNPPIIGITGPPGAGKSTLVSALAGEIIKQNPDAQIGILAIDPTSPFTHGSLLGDRLRMTEHFNHPGIFIRSLATRGAMGGLSAKAIEITDVMCAAGFDYIIIETVGVGQSEIDIAAVADTTLVVFVPESGDEIQTIKSGIMEIADIFVVNKSDRPGADSFVKNIKATLHEWKMDDWEIPVLKTVASSREGITELLNLILKHNEYNPGHQLKNSLLFDKAIHIARDLLIGKIDMIDLKNKLQKAAVEPQFNIYRFLTAYFNEQ